MAFSAGVTLSNSLPLGVPDIVRPSVYTFPSADMLLGVVLERVAVPPVKEKTKSFFSKLPLPLLVLNEASFNVTAIVLLSAAKATEEILGPARSFKVAVLLLWVVLAALYPPSKMALAAGFTVITSVPSAKPDRPIPNV